MAAATTTTRAQDAAFQAAAEAVCAAAARRAEAEAADKEARATFKALAEAFGEQAVTVTGGEYDGARVAVSTQERATFDVDALKDLVGRGVFYAVTARDVVRPAFNEAVRTGRIDRAVADKVTTKTVVERVVANIPKK